MKLMISMVLFLSCSLIASKELLKLSDRTLLIDPHGRGLIYPYKKHVCKYPNRWFNRKCEWKRYEIIYPLDDTKTRDMLINAEFHCISKNRFNY